MFSDSLVWLKHVFEWKFNQSALVTFSGNLPFLLLKLYEQYCVTITAAANMP